MTTPITREGARSPGRTRRVRDVLPGQLREMSRGTVPLLVAFSLLNGSNYVFHVAISRLLGPTQYGALTAVLAVMLVLSVPLGVVQTTVAKRTATLRRSLGEDEVVTAAIGATRVVAPIAMAVLAVGVVASPLVVSFLHVGIASALLLAAFVAASLIVSVPLGSLQGLMRFRVLALVTLAGVAARFVAGVGLVKLGLGVPGALAGTLASQALTLVLAARALHVPFRSWRSARADLAALRGEIWLTLLALSGFWMLAEGDVVLARHLLEPAAAGLYSSAEVLARSLLFLPGAISVAALPRFAQLRNDGPELRRLLRFSLGAVVGLVTLGLGFLSLFRTGVVRVAFGSAFVPAARLVPMLAVGTGLLAVVLLLTYMHVSVGTRAYVVLFSSIGVQSVLIWLFHGSPLTIATIAAGVAAATAVLLYRMAIAACRWPRVEDAPAPAVSQALQLSVVLPCHNAASGLRDVLLGLSRELADVEHEIVVVSDGSTDETVEIARSFPSESVRVIEYADRSGKGHALHAGLSSTLGRYVAFMDSDGDISPAAMQPFLTLMRLYEPDIVLGSKRHPLSQVRYPPLRRLLSWTYHKVTRVLFHVNVRDTQTGMKMLRRDVLAAVLPRMLEKRYAFDLELLVVAKRLRYTRVFEAPIRIDYRFSSNVNPRQAAGIFRDTLGIFYRRYILNTYGPRARGRIAPVHAPLAISTGGGDVQIALGSAESRPLRILVINWRDIRNPDAGGAEVFTHQVTRRWAAAGHDVTLLASRFPGAPSIESFDGVVVRRGGWLRTGTFHLFVQRELSRLSGFDVVVDEINTIPFFTPLWSARLPLTVALIHQLADDVWRAELPAPLAAIGRSMELRMLRLYRETPVATVSRSTREDLERLGHRDVRLIRQGRDDPPTLDGVAKEPVPTLLFVGRLTPNKRPEHVVEAFRHVVARLPGARLWIVGRGGLEARLRSRLPEGAEMLGFLPREELYERMARAHCLVVPSVREGWGMVITEANAVGTPAVGYDVPGIRDAIVPGRTGRLARPGDPAALAGEAVALLSDAAEYRAVTAQARAWASEFTWDRTADELLAFINARLPIADSSVEPARLIQREDALRVELASVG